MSIPSAPKTYGPAGARLRLPDQAGCADLLMTVDALEEQVRTLTTALHSNRRIGIAVGIVVRDQNVSEMCAFEILRRRSMNSNEKLHVVADEVIRHRGLRLPDQTG